MSDHVHVRIQIGQPRLGRLELRVTERGGAVDDLPLQVGEVHDVEVDDADRSHAGRGQIERERRAQAARADGEHARRLELALALHADLGQEEVARVPQHLGVRELGKRGLGRGAAASDARDDREHVALGDRGRGGRELANVRVVEIQVDEGAQAPVVLYEVSLEAGMRGEELVEHLAHGGADDGDGVAPAGEAAERSRNGDGHGHRHTSLRTSRDSGCMRGRSSSSTQLARSAPRPRSMRTIR